MEKDIRLLYNDACAQVIDIILPIQVHEFNVPITAADQPDLQDLESNYHQGGGGFWGAFVDGELVGTIALINTGHAAGAIRKMFVKKEFRGKELGLAQALLETLMEYSQKNGIRDLYLGTVPQLKAALRFYERNGFAQIAVEHLPPYFPRMAVDTLFYHLEMK
ncbi:Acetyltransferase (GNAT) domain-containing protein [Chitinophaga jiangningensis]|uniref:Acetyltransferase (GNAT) domain-containing protein n=1 Tax=Chitinophaga jiangningensis TaxID=1419482 RepID=A0A1M7L865_9BACT|nr:GNAT family N-acetyltransferase [Chitinophaga jiangningensis]SHM73584.1 Acetyltransferase (GNAT) domain-containing protein [Chitinophaga jiangningensis]